MLRRFGSGLGRLWCWFLVFAAAPGRSVELGRYALISGASLFLDLAVLTGLLWFQLMPAAIAGAVSCMAGLVLHYLLSAHVVFDATASGKSDRQLALEYALTGAMGFAITAGAIWLASNIAGLPVASGKALGIVATFVSVYVVRAGIVFAPREASEDFGMPQSISANQHSVNG